MKRILTIISLILAIGFACSQAAAEELTKVRIGWQIPWATQGQLVQILKHTDILKKNGLEAEFIGRTYGPVLNELAMADELSDIELRTAQLHGNPPIAAGLRVSARHSGVRRAKKRNDNGFTPLNQTPTGNLR